MPGYKEIQGYEQLTTLFGAWPSFHDAEVVSLELRRQIPPRSDATQARLSVRLCQCETQWTSDIDYEYVKRNEVLATFLFDGVAEVQTHDFNHQNVINAIRLSDSGNPLAPIRIDVDSIFGFGGCWFCSSITLEKVEPLSENN